MPGPLVDTAWLEAHRGDVVILDVRKDVDSFSARPQRVKRGPIQLNSCGAKRKAGGAEVAGHIPGAVLVPWGEVRAGRTVDGVQLKKLVPEPAAFEP